MPERFVYGNVAVRSSFVDNPLGWTVGSKHTLTTMDYIPIGVMARFSLSATLSHVALCVIWKELMVTGST